MHILENIKTNGTNITSIDTFIFTNVSIQSMAHRGDTMIFEEDTCEVRVRVRVRSGQLSVTRVRPPTLSRFLDNQHHGVKKVPLYKAKLKMSHDCVYKWVKNMNSGSSFRIYRID